MLQDVEHTGIILRKSPEAYGKELVLLIALRPYKTGAGFDMLHFDQLTFKLFNIPYSGYSETVNHIIYLKIKAFIHIYTSISISICTSPAAKPWKSCLAD